jgi:hypothetical protein
MRLLEIQHDGTIALTEDLIGAGNVPAYAILSHTWLPGQEVTFDEFKRGLGRDKAGFDKIRFCAQQAQEDSLRYFWVDTCCINKADHVELQHAINSMFRWYQEATRCYVLLTDVLNAEPATNHVPNMPAWEGEFRRRRVQCFQKAAKSDRGKLAGTVSAKCVTWYVRMQPDNQLSVCLIRLR